MDVLSELRGHDSQRIARESFARSGQAGKPDILSGMIAADLATLLPDDYLVKVDRASMANGLEVRPPLLDHEFLELCARLPSRWKIRDGETKWLLRELSRDVLPDSIRNRPKQGFEVPLDAWFRGPLRSMFADLVLSPNSPVTNLINPREARRVFDAHQRGTARNGSTLWSLLSLAAWSERYLASSLPQRGFVTQPRVASEASYPGLDQANQTYPERVASSPKNDGTPLGFETVMNS